MNSPGTYCLSCKTPFTNGAQFCHSCGQNKRASILSFRELWTNFFSTIFTVDNAFFRTLKLIVRPDKLTQRYVAGDRKKYLNPIRMFLLMLIFLVATILLITKNQTNLSFLKYVHKSYYTSLVYEKLDNKIASYPIGDSTRLEFEKLSESLFPNVKCPDIDTLKNGIVMVSTEGTKKILKRDFVEMSIEEINEKYNSKTYWEKLLLGQYVRLNKDPSAAIKFLINNAGWGIIPSILIICVLLKFLFWNHKIRYLEHLVFMANIHSFLFLVTILLLLSQKIVPESLHGKILGATIISTILLVYFFFKQYYREGLFRSTFKFLVVFVCYFFSTLISLALAAVASGFLF